MARWMGGPSPHRYAPRRGELGRYLRSAQAHASWHRSPRGPSTPTPKLQLNPACRCPPLPNSSARPLDSLKGSLLTPQPRLLPQILSPATLSHANAPRGIIASRGGRSWHTPPSHRLPPQPEQRTGSPAAVRSPQHALGGTESPDDRGDDLNLMYDPILNCYYDPKTNKYYQLA